MFGYFHKFAKLANVNLCLQLKLGYHISENLSNAIYKALLAAPMCPFFLKFNIKLSPRAVGPNTNSACVYGELQRASATAVFH